MRLPSYFLVLVVVFLRAATSQIVAAGGDGKSDAKTCGVDDAADDPSSSANNNNNNNNGDVTKHNLYDYLIVGAGGAGIQTALVLERYNMSYLVVEKLKRQAPFGWNIQDLRN